MGPPGGWRRCAFATLGEAADPGEEIWAAADEVAAEDTAGEPSGAPEAAGDRAVRASGTSEPTPEVALGGPGTDVVSEELPAEPEGFRGAEVSSQDDVTWPGRDEQGSSTGQGASPVAESTAVQPFPSSGRLVQIVSGEWEGMGIGSDEDVPGEPRIDVGEPRELPWVGSTEESPHQEARAKQPRGGKLRRWLFGKSKGGRA